MTYLVTSKPTLTSKPTIFNLHASDQVHCEEKTGAYYQLSQNTYKLGKKNYKFFKLFILTKEISSFQKNPNILLLFFFQKVIIGHMYIYLLNAIITSNFQ